MREPFDKPTLKLLPDSATTEKAFRKKVIREITEAEERRRSKIMAGLAPKVSTKTVNEVLPERPAMPNTPVFEDDNTLKSDQRFIPGGSFNIARKIFSSEIWIKHPFYLKVWLWIVGQANHSDHQKSGYLYKRGELITSYDGIIKGVAYHYRHRLIFPSIQQIRDIVKWLESDEMIIVQPLRKNDSLAQEIAGETTGFTTDPNAGDKTDPKRRDKTYLGIRIIVINYDTYQTLDNYKKTGGKLGEKTDPNAGDKTGGFSEIQHNNKNDKKEKNNIYSQNFLNYWKAYPNRVAKKKAHEAWNKLERAEDMEALLPTLLNAIEKQQQAKEILKTKGEFTPEWPHGATWLNGRRWEDEIEIKQGYDGF